MTSPLSKHERHTPLHLLPHTLAPWLTIKSMGLAIRRVASTFSTSRRIGYRRKRRFGGYDESNVDSTSAEPDTKRQDSSSGIVPNTSGRYDCSICLRLQAEGGPQNGHTGRNAAAEDLVGCLVVVTAYRPVLSSALFKNAIKVLARPWHKVPPSFLSPTTTTSQLCPRPPECQLEDPSFTISFGCGKIRRTVICVH
jgi:hypothetical protein